MERIRQFAQRHLSGPEQSDMMNKNTVKAICEKHMVHLTHGSMATSPSTTLVMSLAHHPNAIPASFGDEDQLGGLPVIPHLTAAELSEKQRSYAIIREVINQMESGERPPPSVRKELPELWRILREWNKLTLIDGILHRK